MAMEDRALKKYFEELELLTDKLESRLRYYETNALNATMAFLCWERLFTSGILQASSFLDCTHFWVVLALNLSCTVVYFLFLLGSVIMLYRARCQMNIICQERTEICQRIEAARNRMDAAAMEAGDSSDGFQFNFHATRLCYDSCTLFNNRVFIGSTICALLAVTTFELLACKHLICK